MLRRGASTPLATWQRKGKLVAGRSPVDAADQGPFVRQPRSQAVGQVKASAGGEAHDTSGGTAAEEAAEEQQREAALGDLFEPCTLYADLTAGRGDADKEDREIATSAADVYADVAFAVDPPAPSQPEASTRSGDILAEAPQGGPVGQSKDEGSAAAGAEHLPDTQGGAGDGQGLR